MESLHFARKISSKWFKNSRLEVAQIKNCMVIPVQGKYDKLMFCYKLPYSDKEGQNIATFIIFEDEVAKQSQEQLSDQLTVNSLARFMQLDAIVSEDGD